MKEIAECINEILRFGNPEKVPKKTVALLRDLLIKFTKKVKDQSKFWDSLGHNEVSLQTLQTFLSNGMQSKTSVSIALASVYCVLLQISGSNVYKMFQNSLAQAFVDLIRCWATFHVIGNQLH